MTFREKLQDFLQQRGWSQTHFSRLTGIPRQTITDWLAGALPSPKWREKIRESTGIIVTDEGVLEEIIPLRPRVLSLNWAEDIYHLVSPIGSILVHFVQDSTKEQRIYFRESMGDRLEDLLDGARGLYSEKAREEMLQDRARMRERKNRKEVKS